MEERINVAEILRNFQSGMNLDCVCFENVVFDRVDDKNRIRCFVGSQRDEVSFNEYGCLNGSPSAKCVIFPKGETTWEGFIPPCTFKDGDVVISTLGNIAIISNKTNNKLYSTYCILFECGIFTTDYTTVCPKRLANEEEKQKLFDAIKANGYRWNPETKTPEKLSKFYVGDWVIDKQGIVHQIANVIENVTNHTYGYDIVGGGYFNDNTEGVRLWTIQDAKDGDVLVDNLPFIFKKIDSMMHSYAYCGISIDGDFKIKSEGESGEWTWMQDIKPATKEQRDLLFQKMKDAGYEWDAEKKELKKIEQKPVEWSEEDENKIDFIKGFITMGRFADTNTIRTIWELLDSLCPSWKPSDKQMEQLGWIAEQNKNNMIGQELMTLYNDLKKLKGRKYEREEDKSNVVSKLRP